jgi:hypothetical protein
VLAYSDDEWNRSFLRRGKNPQNLFVVVMNATPVVRPGYHVGVLREAMPE